MASVLDIYSNALILLGQNPLQSEDEDSDIAYTLRTRYPILRNRVLAQYHWKFTIKMVQLAKDPTAPTARFSYQYELPSESLDGGVRAVYQSDNVNAPHYQQYIVQGKYLLTNSDTIFIEYKAPISEGDFPDHFVDLICHMLASDCATTITDDSTITKRIDAIAEKLLAGAITLDSQSGPASNRISNFQLITAKRSGTGII